MNLSLINPFRLSRLTVPLWFFGFVPYKLGEALLITLLPLFIVQTVNGSVTDVGRVHSLTSLAGVIAFIVWGNLSDRLKLRRPFLILGFCGFALCTALTATAQGIEQVMIFSTLGAFFMAALTPVASALVIDGNPEDRWANAFGQFYQISGWSFVGGVLLGASWLAFLPIHWTSMGLRSLLLLTGLTWAAISISSTTIVAKLAPKGQEAIAMGSYNSLIGIATIIGSLVGGMMAVSYGYSACFITGALLMGLTAAQLWWIGRIPNRILQK
jgi:MFS family permease